VRESGWCFHVSYSQLVEKELIFLVRWKNIRQGDSGGEWESGRFLGGKSEGIERMRGKRRRGLVQESVGIIDVEMVPSETLPGGRSSFTPGILSCAGLMA